VGVQEIRWEGEGYQTDNCILFCGKWNVYYQLGAGYFVHNKIISAVKRVEFFSDNMSYINLKGHWCDIIVLNVHAQLMIKMRTQNTAFTKNQNWYLFSSLGTI